MNQDDLGSVKDGAAAKITPQQCLMHRTSATSPTYAWL